MFCPSVGSKVSFRSNSKFQGFPQGNEVVNKKKNLNYAFLSIHRAFHILEYPQILALGDKIKLLFHL